VVRARGGRREALPHRLREKALALEKVVGVEKAAKELGVKAGTLRSWRRREQVRLARAAALSGDSAGLEAVKEQGRQIVARRESLMASSAGERLREASERVRLATIRWLDTSAGGPGRTEAEIELVEAKIALAELEEGLNRDW